MTKLIFNECVDKRPVAKMTSKKIFIQRDYSFGTAVRFSTDFPRELSGKVTSNRPLTLWKKASKIWLLYLNSHTGWWSHLQTDNGGNQCYIRRGWGLKLYDFHRGLPGMSDWIHYTLLLQNSLWKSTYVVYYVALELSSDATSLYPCHSASLGCYNIFLFCSRWNEWSDTFSSRIMMCMSSEGWSLVTLWTEDSDVYP